MAAGTGPTSTVLQALATTERIQFFQGYPIARFCSYQIIRYNIFFYFLFLIFLLLKLYVMIHNIPLFFALSSSQYSLLTAPHIQQFPSAITTRMADQFQDSALWVDMHAKIWHGNTQDRACGSCCASQNDCFLHDLH